MFELGEGFHEEPFCIHTRRFPHKGKAFNEICKLCGGLARLSPNRECVM